MISDATESGKYINSTKKRIREEGVKRSRMVQPGDFLLTNSMSFGRPYIMNTSGCIHDGWLVLSPRHKNVSPDFFYHLLGSDFVYAEFLRRAAGATVKNLNIDLVKSVRVPLPPVAEQRRIAKILDRAEALRAKRRSALARLDSLTQSFFLDLFGEPDTNPKRMRKSSLGELIKLKSGDFLPATAMAKAGLFPVFGGNGINGYHDQYMFDDPQIIVGRVGVYCGCVHVSPPKSWVTDNALYISERKKAVEFGYLVYALMRANLNRYASQSGQPLVSGSRIYPVEILVPPIDLQREFAQRVGAVEKLKTAHKASLAELDALFASLQHRAFRGEL